jgi:hypothetical protein
MKNLIGFPGLVLTAALFFHTTTFAQWVKIKSPNWVSAICLSGSNLYAGTNVAGNYAGGIFRSTINDTTWIAVNTGLPTGVAVTALCACGSNIFAGTLLNGVFRLANNGSTWTAVTNGLPPPDNTGYVWQTISSFAVSGATIFAGERDGSLFRSTDSGKTWWAAPTITGVTNTSVISFAAKGDTVYAGLLNGGILRSVDNGGNWDTTKIASTGFPHLAVTAFAVSGATIFGGTDAGINGGVYRSIDNCATWTAETSGLPVKAYVNALAVDSTILFAYISGSGLWRRLLSDMVKIKRSLSPANFFRSNTLNIIQTGQQTHIEFCLHEHAFVKLSAFNLKGVQVCNLSLGEFPAGTFNIPLKVAGLSSGNYRIRLDAGRYSETAKVILIR